MASRGVTVRDVSSHDFIKAYAKFLKKQGKLEIPKWVDLVKTAPRKELAPLDQDWYFVRAASIARKVYLRNGLGVGGFRRIYGGNRDRGTCPKHFQKSAGGLIRHILINLEKNGLVEKDTKGGRRITNEGQRDLDRIAGQVYAAAPPAAF